MEIIVVAHNIRSTHNIGSIFRSCEGFGVQKIILSGYSPYPQLEHDNRLPHIVQKLTKQIEKTALGASQLVPFEYVENPTQTIEGLRANGYRIVGLEQASNSILLPNYQSPQRVCLLLGEEVEGIANDLLEICDEIVEIPMAGTKESFNVSVATGIALYGLIYAK